MKVYEPLFSFAEMFTGKPEGAKLNPTEFLMLNGVPAPVDNYTDAERVDLENRGYKETHEP